MSHVHKYFSHPDTCCCGARRPEETPSNPHRDRFYVDLAHPPFPPFTGSVMIERERTAGVVVNTVAPTETPTCGEWSLHGWQRCNNPLPCADHPAVEVEPGQRTVEQILQAAILASDGVTVYTQPRPSRHGTIMQAAWALGHGKIGPDHQGFITTTGRFVGRAEAFEIAHMAGQILGADAESGHLMTEDVW